MSTVFVHVGQCGNQLGRTFWDEASKPHWSGGYHKPYTAAEGSQRAKTSSLAPRVQTGASRVPTSTTPRAKFVKDGPHKRHVPFSLVDGSLPCVLVDTEPKVIRRCLDGRRDSGMLTQRVHNDCCIWDKAGRGNNWACGYHGAVRGMAGVRGQELAERVLEAVRRTVERCDRFSGFVVFHSIAGGTGSGLGSALLEQLRAHYPLAFIITVTVAPFQRGETPLQHLNSLLCLSWLQSYSDAVLLFSNDSLLTQAQKLAAAGGRVVGGGREEERAVDVKDMNRHAAGVLCNTFMPLWQNKQKSPKLSYQEPWELIRSLCPDPRSKFITPTHVHSASPNKTWSQLTTSVSQHSSSSSQWKHEAKSKSKTSALVFVARSSPSNTEQLIQGLGPLEGKLKKAYKTVEWNPFPVDFWLSHEPAVGQNAKLATVLANSSTALDYIGPAYERAEAMFGAGAYLHWYERYGCERGDFEQAFASVRDIIRTYEEF